MFDSTEDSKLILKPDELLGKLDSTEVVALKEGRVLSFNISNLSFYPCKGQVQAAEVLASYLHDTQVYWNHMHADGAFSLYVSGGELKGKAEITTISDVGREKYAMSNLRPESLRPEGLSVKSVAVRQVNIAQRREPQSWRPGISIYAMRNDLVSEVYAVHWSFHCLRDSFFG